MWTEKKEKESHRDKNTETRTKNETCRKGVINTIAGVTHVRAGWEGVGGGGRGEGGRTEGQERGISEEIIAKCFKHFLNLRKGSNTQIRETNSNEDE